MSIGCAIRLDTQGTSAQNLVKSVCKEIPIGDCSALRAELILKDPPMTVHAETQLSPESHVLHTDPRIQLAAALKFEPSEVHDFDMADKAAGQMMGKLLAALFCVLLFLMTGVNIWMLTHASTIKDTDPQAFAYGNRAEHTAGEHAADGHH